MPYGGGWRTLVGASEKPFVCPVALFYHEPPLPSEAFNPDVIPREVEGAVRYLVNKARSVGESTDDLWNIDTAERIVLKEILHLQGRVAKLNRTLDERLHGGYA